jgi:muramoyltetrapeptide carboxypeptidase LdcA involved in peptidoglycan recycling
MLPYLNLDEENAKWVQGYSDVSLLLYYITTRWQIATLNGANVKSFGMEPLHESLVKNLEIVQNVACSKQKSFDKFEGARFDSENPYDPFHLTDDVCYKALYPEKETEVRGRVIGGCLDVLGVLFGTPFDYTTQFCEKFSEGMLWYIDNCEMNLAEFRRRIWQANLNGWFENVKGFLIGRTPVAKEYIDYTYEEMLHDCFDKYNVPVFYDVDIGHVAPQWTMINGALGEFKFFNGKGELTQKMVE